MRLGSSARSGSLAVLLACWVIGCAQQRPADRPSAPLGQPRADVERLLPVAPTRPLRIGIRVGVADAVVAPTESAGADALVEVMTAAGVRLGAFRGLRFDSARDGVRVDPSGHEARVLRDTLRCAAPAGGHLVADGRSYRGELVVFPAPAGGLTIVNVIELEDYLLGVVPLEIGWPGPDAAEVVKAQAVAARTYALSHLGRWSEEGFDLYGDEQDQVYGGIAAERAEITDAVRRTAGLVATYDNLLINAFYSACCGGRTAPAHETWDFEPMPYLVTQRDRRGGADFCAGSRHYRWEEVWSSDEIVALLQAHYTEEFGGTRAPGGSLEDLVIESRYDSGRVKSLQVRSGGRRYRMGGDRIRWVLRRGGPGGAILRSSLFDVELERREGRVVRVKIRGGGNGHGVGMCQSGAIEMARQGYSFDEILEHYYRGIELRALWRT